MIIIGYSKYSLATKSDNFNRTLQKAISFKNKDFDSLFYYANISFKMAVQSKDYNQKVDVYKVLIEAKIRSGDLTDALTLCDSIESITIKHKLSHRLPDTYINFGNVYRAIGFKAEAFDNLFKALDNPEINSQVKNKIDLYHYIALTYYSLNEISNCRKYAKLSMSLAIKNNILKEAIPSMLLLSNISTKVDSIQYYLNKANQILQYESTLLYEKTIVLNKMARVNKAIGKYQLSNTQYLEAIKISRHNGFKDNLAILLNNYGYLLLAQNKIDSAKLVFSEALHLAKQLDNLDNLATVYDSYQDYYKKIDNYKLALQYLDSSLIYRNQYRQQQQVQKSLFLSAVFETEQKEKEILEQENEIRLRNIYIISVVAALIIAIILIIYFRQRNKLAKAHIVTIKKENSLEIADAIIQAQDSERKQLAMDLHDGMGGLLGGMRFDVDNALFSNKNYEMVINYITNIHDNMRSISHRMQPPELEKRGLVPAINNLIKSINKSGKLKIEFEFDIEIELPEKIKTNIYFLAYELINNAIKHSNGNSIFVQLLEHENEISLSVEDNGTDFHYDESMVGMGMKNIQTRVNYLNGNINIESTGHDTSIMIDIPI